MARGVSLTCPHDPRCCAACRREYKRRWQREYARRRAAKRLAAARQVERTCPRRFGMAVCGGLLRANSDGTGRVSVTCERCERFNRGICMECNAPVAGKVGRARRCAFHKRMESHEARRRYRREHLRKVRAMARRYARRKDVRRRKAEYNRAWDAANPERRVAQRRRSDEHRRERVLAYMRQWRAEVKAGTRKPKAQPRDVYGRRICLDCEERPTEGRSRKCAECRARARREGRRKLIQMYEQSQQQGQAA